MQKLIKVALNPCSLPQQRHCAFKNLLLAVFLGDGKAVEIDSVAGQEAIP